MRPRHVLLFWDALNCALWFVVGISLAGCVGTDAYWARTGAAPMAVKGVIEVERPGGRDDLIGFSNYGTGMIEVKRGLEPIMRDCVIRHEYRHFAGWTHEERRGWATNCGDGMMVPFYPR